MQGDAAEEKYIVKKLEELEVMSDSELIDYVIEGESNKKTIKINRNQAPWKLRTKRNLTLKNEDVISLYDLENKVDGMFYFPYMDERKHPYYLDEKTKTSRVLQGKEKMTPKRYFRLIDTELDEGIFGLYTTETYCCMVPLKKNDFRWADVIKNGRIDGTIDKKYFYYDYENSVFVQVNRDKYVDMKTGEIKRDKDKNPLDEKTVELLRREELLEYVMERFMVLDEEFVIHFEDTWNILKKVDFDSTSVVFEFLNTYKDFMEKAEENLKVKMVLGLIDTDEYTKLKLNIKMVMEKVAAGEKRSEDILDFLGVEDFVFTDRKNNGYAESLNYVKYLGTFNENSSSKLLKTLFSILVPKPEFKDKKEERYTFDGYLDESDSNTQLTKLYPNLSTINTRYFFTQHQDSQDKRKGYEDRLLSVLNRDIGVKVKVNEDGTEEVQVAENVPMYMKIYTSDEILRFVEMWKVTEGRKQVKNNYRNDLKEYPSIKASDYSLLMDQFFSYLNSKL